MTRSLVWMLLCLIPVLATAQDEPLRLGFKGELLSLNRTQLISRDAIVFRAGDPAGQCVEVIRLRLAGGHRRA